MSTSNATQTAGHDLTTARAPFIENARGQGELFIEQPWHLYSADNHEAWRRLYHRMLPRWRRYANPMFLEGIDNLAFDTEAVPRLEDVNRFLEPLTGFRAKAVSGYVPAYLFFDSIRQRDFPTTITIRDKNRLDYLPEPDIFHDIAGHVPMHTNRRFADVLVRFGGVARLAAQRAMELDVGGEERERILRSNIKALARFFWFTIEFGLMKAGAGGGVCAYGSGLLSSFGEIEHAVDGPAVQRWPFRLEWVVNQYFEIHHFQPLLFVVDSFEHLFGEVGRLEEWLGTGQLDNVSPGEPEVGEMDLESFLGVEG